MQPALPRVRIFNLRQKLIRLYFARISSFLTRPYGTVAPSFHFW